MAVESNQHSSWEIVKDAALGGAEYHAGPSDISTADYSALVDKSIGEVESLLEQLETARAEAERSEKYAEERDLAAQEFEEQLEAEQGLRRSADAALEAMGERLEHVIKSLDEYDAQRDVAVARAERLQEQ